jgi:hypothetical protein
VSSANEPERKKAGGETGVQIPRSFIGNCTAEWITGVGQRRDCAHRIERTKSSQVTERHTPRCRCKFPREWLTCGISLEVDEYSIHLLRRPNRETVLLNTTGVSPSIECFERKYVRSVSNAESSLESIQSSIVVHRIALLIPSFARPAGSNHRFWYAPTVASLQRHRGVCDSEYSGTEGW